MACQVAGKASSQTSLCEHQGQVPDSSGDREAGRNGNSRSVRPLPSLPPTHGRQPEEPALSSPLNGLPTKEGHIHSPGPGWAQDGHGSNDPQGALRPDEELLQVVACVVLPQGGQAVQDSTVGEHLARSEGSVYSSTPMFPTSHHTWDGPSPGHPEKAEPEATVTAHEYDKRLQ